MKVARVLFNVMAASALVFAGFVFINLVKASNLQDSSLFHLQKTTVLALLFAVVSTLSSAAIWVSLDPKAHGGNLIIESFGSISLSQFGKYAPGTVWPAVIQGRIESHFGSKASLAYSRFVVYIGAHLTTGLLLAFCLTGLRFVLWDSKNYQLQLVIVGFTLMVLVFTFYVKPWSRRFEIGGLRNRLLVIVVSLIGFWVSSGLALVMLLVGQGRSIDGQSFMNLVGAYAKSYSLGMMSFFSPGGLGVRELVLQSSLDEQISPGVNAVVVLELRVVQTLADGLVAALGFFILATSNRRRSLGANAKQEGD